MIKIAVILEKCEEGGYSAHVPTVPGCFGEGETIEETLSQIREAIELHLEAADDDLIVEEGAIVKELVWLAPVSPSPADRPEGGPESLPLAPQEQQGRAVDVS